VAKTLALIVAGVVVSGLTFGLSLATIVIELHAHGFHQLPAGTARLFLDSVLAATLFGLIGAALGYITRSTIAAVVGAVGWVLFVELALLHTPALQLAKWLITGAAGPLTDPTATGPGNLSPTVAVVVLAVYALALLVIATQFVRVRHVS
jgi:ABC-2 type transport system permease protein